MKSFYRFIAFLIFASIVLLGFLFAVNNTTEVALWIGIDLPPFSIGVLVIIVFITGGLVGLLLGIEIFRQMKYLFQIRKLRSELENLKSNAVHKKN
ncbi:MAG: hypothetical protein ACKVKR_12465 [Pseudomonadales bacterium]